MCSKNLCIAIFYVLSCNCLNAQSQNYASINANYILSGMNSNGKLFLNEEDEGVFIGPNVAGADKASTLFVGNIWLGARQSDGAIHISESKYGDPMSSFQSGPLNVTTGELFDGAETLFQRVWSVNRTEILALKEDISDGVIDEPIAKDIIEWPAKGNTYFQDVFANQDGAAFYDNNSDGVYNAYDGDYPLVGDDLPELIPDQILFCIFNDRNPLSFLGPTLGVEVQLTMYAMLCEENPSLNHSIFTRHKVLNRSNIDYEELFLGVFLDGDVGCYTDDYAGCDPSNNMTYFYNRDAVDGEENQDCPGGIASFQEEVPVQSLRFLNRRMDNFIYFYNPAFSQIPCATCEPLHEEEHLNYLLGSWKDGTAMTYGGNGFNATSTDTVSHAFSGNPNIIDEWSMSSVQLELGDRRTLSTYAHGSFKKAEEFIFDAVYTFNRKAGMDYLENVDVAIQQSIEIQNAYDQKFQMSCTQNLLCASENCVYPGDVNDDEVVDRLDVMFYGLAYAYGQETFEVPRKFLTTKWDEFKAEARSTSFMNGVNHVHADGDGNGIVDLEEDWKTLQGNFGNRTRKYIEEELFTEPFPFSGEIIIELPDVHNVDQNLGFLGGDIAIENMQNFHSVSYVLEYDPEIFEPIGDYAMPSVSGVADPGLGFVHSLGEGKLLIVKANAALGIANVERISDGVLLKHKPNAMPGSTQIRVTEILISDFAENFYTLDDVEKEIILEGSSVSIETIDNAAIEIYPNPSSGIVKINGDLDLKSYELYDVRGVLCQKGTVLTDEIIINQADGIYLFKFYNKQGLVAQKKIVVN